MPVFNKFNLFSQDVAEGAHNFKTGSTAVYKIMLTNTAPSATNHRYADINATELPAGAGYTTGGLVTTITDTASGPIEIVKASAVTWTASGLMGPFRYAVVYRSDDANQELACWLDYGSSITMNPGDTFTVQPDATNGLFSII